MCDTINSEDRIVTYILIVIRGGYSLEYNRKSGIVLPAALEGDLLLSKTPTLEPYWRAILFSTSC